MCDPPDAAAARTTIFNGASLAPYKSDIQAFIGEGFILKFRLGAESNRKYVQWKNSHILHGEAHRLSLHRMALLRIDLRAGTGDQFVDLGVGITGQVPGTQVSLRVVGMDDGFQNVGFAAA